MGRRISGKVGERQGSGEKVRCNSQSEEAPGVPTCQLFFVFVFFLQRKGLQQEQTSERLLEFGIVKLPGVSCSWE